MRSMRATVTISSAILDTAFLQLPAQSIREVNRGSLSYQLSYGPTFALDQRLIT